ncbi:MAG: phosphoglucosamine mutase [Halobacteriovoraceae bacterium]|nr:phosphoglucosamine mutase [Halobacteriovoraceae bacterium]|tara:strand:+ start:10095 stop:11459 length:1365 start_codon:yes stop_codon:yes gene_type:complete
MSQRKLFGTDGIRGRANVFPMTGEIAFALGRAVTAHFQTNSKNKKPVIIIGKDTRLSCYMLEQAFSAGVCSQGGKAILTGPLPTPGVAFVTQSMRADAGIMISASHNAYNDNGIKIFDRTGHKLPDEVEAALEKMILNNDLIPKKLDDELGNAKRLDEVVGRYIVKVKQALSEEYTLDGIRLVVDGANGAGYKVAPMAFAELGADVVAMGNEPNGTNINLNVGALHPESCAEKVKKYRADYGICLDGDGDRLTFINSNGKVIHGDQLLGVLAKFLAKTNKLGSANEVVGTVMSNLGLEKYVQSLGANFTRTKVGDRYIVERMLHSNAVFGGEPSGHIIFKDFSTTGDGILAALKVLECIKYFDCDLADLVEEVQLMPQLLKNIKVKEKKDFATLNSVQKTLKEVEGQLGNRGRVLLRYSGTENLARVMVEGEDDHLIDECCEKLVDSVKNEIGV